MRVILFIITLCIAANCAAQEFYLFVGTYTNNGSKGIYVYKFNAATGKAQWVSNTDSVVNPSYLHVTPDGKFVYAVNETGGDQPGSVSAFSFDKKTGQLSLINKQRSGGDHPCYISADKNGKWVVVANYTGGNLSAIPVAENGALQLLTQLVQHTGSSINRQRQVNPHVHAVVFSPAQDHLFATDLGTDKIMAYKFNGKANKPLQPAKQPYTASMPGSGPRHLTFHPNGRFIYVLEELSGKVTGYRYSNGNLVFIQRISAHPKDYKGAFGSADIHVSKDGKFLYTSNRGNANSITIFSVTSNGRLQWKGYQSTMGVHPRNFVIDPTGTYLLVANRNTNNIVVFKRNKKTGLLLNTGFQIEVPSPVCLKMLKINTPPVL
ncbi:MAG: lactonase family protein [Chitinophagaceae bacterium]